MQKPSNPPGTRDFGPDVMRKRNYLLGTIKDIFIKYGFEPLETPALEHLDTLTGKYGDEGDKLLYKIRSNRDIKQEISKVEADKLTELFPEKWIAGESKLGLRYDLTVPFARFVVQHRNDINFPFRRYQIQPVWRADKPQQGRFREFTQCDADCIGSDSLLHEADLICIYNDVFKKLGLNRAVLKINHRKFLEALVDELNLDFPVVRFTSTLDKLDKIGKEGVTAELVKLGVDEEKCEKLFQIIGNSKLTRENLVAFGNAFNDNAIANEAIKELSEILDYLENADIDLNIELDLSLARGLDYYTGCIFEAIVLDSKIGSISGGGRYDNLTSVFGLDGISGVGISFGVDRIYEIFEAQNLWPTDLVESTSLLICHFDKPTQLYAMQVAKSLRAAELATIVYPDNKRINKQFDFANKIGTKYVVVIGETEMETGLLTLKNLQDGTQQKLTVSDLIAFLKP